LLLILFLHDKGVARSQPAQAPTEKEGTAPYMKTFLAITAFFKRLDEEFIKTAKTEQKKGLLRQITFMRSDMVDVISAKKNYLLSLKVIILMLIYMTRLLILKRVLLI